MFTALKQWREKRILANSEFSASDWQEAASQMPVLDQLNTTQQKKLFKLATLFLHAKTIDGAHEFEITDEVRQSIALQACLPILELGLDGEAWLRGPVILSWTSVETGGIRDGHNVVIHEFVHKLDMLNGRANGFPPMQPGMDPVMWSNLMSNAFDDFRMNPKEGLDRYGATNPAEFFAVLSEVFFETPALLVDAYPELYEIMSQFFLQSPLDTNSSYETVTTPA